MTGFNSKRDAAADKLQEPNTITFSTSSADWVMRITADRRIEVNDGVEVTEAAKKVLEAMQWMLKPAQEPVAFICQGNLYMIEDVDKYCTAMHIPLYIAPPQREWAGLTGDELADLWYKESLDWMEFARAHEAELKEKNT